MLLKSIYKSELSSAKRTALLKKIRLNHALKSSRVVIDKHTGGEWKRYLGQSLLDLVIDETQSTATIILDAGPESGIGAKATVDIQDLTFEADAPGSPGNDITIAYTNFTAAVKASKVIQDLTYQADTAGTGGNAITVAYVGDGTAGSETVGVVGSAITVHIEDGVSTATQVKAAVDGSLAAAALVDVSITGTGSNPQVAAVAANLTGGAAAIGAAGSEVVTVVGKAISVKLQSGVSTATQVKAKLDASAAAAALVNVTISGTGSNAQTAPVSATNLADGDDVQTFDAADVLDIRRLRTKKYRIVLKSGANPA